jgi:hypothetical protein
MSLRVSGLGLLALVLLLAPPVFAKGGGGDCDVTGGVGVAQPFQFSDAFYIEHGIDPTTTTDHFVFPDAKPGFDRTRFEASPDPDVYNNVRTIETTGGWRHNGNLLYYEAPSKLFPTDFLDNCAGQETRDICESFTAYLFPKSQPNGPPLLSPAPPNRRQDNIFQTNNGYWSNNPLGCWSLAFPSWDGANVNNQTCQNIAQDIFDGNGNELDLEGNPIIKKISEIEDLEDEGCIRVPFRRFTGEDGFPWVI